MKRRLSPESRHIVSGESAIDTVYADMAHARLARHQPDLDKRLVAVLSRLGHEAIAVPAAKRPRVTMPRAIDDTQEHVTIDYFPDAPVDTNAGKLCPLMYESPSVPLELAMAVIHGIPSVSVTIEPTIPARVLRLPIDRMRAHPFTIGRNMPVSFNLSLCVPDFDLVSRRHMEIYYDPNEAGYVVKNTGKNAVLIDNVNYTRTIPPCIIRAHDETIHTVKTSTISQFVLCPRLITE